MTTPAVLEFPVSTRPSVCRREGQWASCLGNDQVVDGDEKSGACVSGWEGLDVKGLRREQVSPESGEEKGPD